MNKYKEDLDSLFSKLETYKFTCVKIEKLIEQDLKQLEEGGDFLNLSTISIRDWSNLSDKNWLVDYKRLSFYGKEEYIREIDEIKSSVYKHYLIETYERLADFLGSLLLINSKKNVNIENVVNKLDVALNNTQTPFGFNMITFLFCFCKVRNAFTHNESILNQTEEFKCNQDYLSAYDIDLKKCEQFIKAYFDIEQIDESTLRLKASKTTFDTIIGFTKSFAFELYKFYCKKDGIDWTFPDVAERYDIKTDKPLTEKQKAYSNTIKG